MQNETVEELFENHRGLCIHLTNKFAQKHHFTGDDREDLLSTAYVGLLTAIKRFTPEKGKLGTYAYRCIYWNLMFGVGAAKNRRRAIKSMPYESLFYENEMEFNMEERFATPKSWKTRLLQEIGEEGKDLILTILHAPAEITDEICGVKCGGQKARKAIRRYFQEHKGWSKKKFRKVWEEVRIACR